MKSKFMSFNACSNKGSSFPSKELYGKALAAFSDSLVYSAAEVDILYVDGRRNLDEDLNEVQAMFRVRFRARYMSNQG